MNSNQPGQRFRGPPNETLVRPGNDPRNGSYANGPVPPSASSGGFSAATQMSRADKFEDEKKRIIESCFSKTEDDGTRMSLGQGIAQTEGETDPRQRVNHTSPIFASRKMRISHQYRPLVSNQRRRRSLGSS